MGSSACVCPDVDKPQKCHKKYATTKATKNYRYPQFNHPIPTPPTSYQKHFHSSLLPLASAFCFGQFFGFSWFSWLFTPSSALEKKLAAGVKVARIYKIHIDAANVIYQRVTARKRKGVGPKKVRWGGGEEVQREAFEKYAKMHFSKNEHFLKLHNKAAVLHTFRYFFLGLEIRVIFKDGMKQL